MSTQNARLSFIQHFDLSDAIHRFGTQIVYQAKINIIVIMALIGCVVPTLWAWCWYYDFGSTVEFGQAMNDPGDAFGLAFGRIEGTVDPFEALGGEPSETWGALLGVSFLVPTLLEILTPLLVSWGVRTSSWLWWGLILFDALTDRPRAIASMNGMEEPIAEFFGPFAGFVMFLLKILFTFGVSFMLEFWLMLLVVLFLVCGLALISPRLAHLLVQRYGGVA